MRPFKYDVIELINCIRERPCLWDKSIVNYKDRLERRAAWEEIIRILDDTYDDLTPEEQNEALEPVINKWTNVRDAFVKTLRTKYGKPRRRYLLHKHLTFLMKNVPEEETYEDVTYLKEEDEDDEEQEHNIEHIEMPTSRKRSQHYDDYSDYVPGPSKSKNSRKRSKSNEEYSEDIFSQKTKENCDSINFVGLDDSCKVMNEDEAFFASVLPTIVNYDEDDKLEFRMGVLAVMKKIKDNRRRK